MQSKSDVQLLREYVRQGVENSFAEIVRRHTNLVYSAALRQVDSPDIAAEISQQVFIGLARGAKSLSSRFDVNASLAGWLCRSARNLALNHRRDEFRRHSRERQVMEQLVSASDPPLAWDRLRPVLDDAMAELTDVDYDALVLRFFQNQDLRSIGAAIGLSDDAAQKRVSRALEKLRGLLARRGIPTAGAALGTALSANAVQVAPAGLAATLTTTSLAGAAVATSSFISTIITLMTSAKTTTALTALVVFTLVGGAVVKLYKANTTRQESGVAPREEIEQVAKYQTHPMRAQTSVSTRIPVNGENDALLVAELAKIQAVLDQPRPGRNTPNPDMVAAISALGDHRRAAIPMLRAALKSADPKLRQQAAEGLGLIGAEAAEAIPDLLAMLRASTSSAGNQPGDRAGNFDPYSSMHALKMIGPQSDVLADLAQILQQNPVTRQAIARTVPEIFPDQSAAVDQVFRPLLQDSDPTVRREAACILAVLLKGQAGPDVVSVAIESLKTSAASLAIDGPTASDKSPAANRNFSAQEIPLEEALTALHTAGMDSNDPYRNISPAILGSAVGDAIEALVDAVKNTRQDNTRQYALRLLDHLDPELEQEPGVAALLTNYRQMNALMQNAANGQATVPELIEAINQSPKAASETADALARFGTDAQAALPALQAALANLEPTAEVVGADRAQAYRNRDAVASAIQKIAPDQPKPLFTLTDVSSIFDILDAPEVRADPARQQRIEIAAQPARAEATDHGLELTPDQIRTLLEALKGADQSTYTAVALQVQKLDPHFLGKSTQ